MKNRITATVIGVIVAAVGILWILQGFDALGQSGGMNGNKTWSWIGIVVLLAGLALIYVFNRPKRIQ
jgi:LPXTG-motif cell wall-anchored protein